MPSRIETRDWRGGLAGLAMVRRRGVGVLVAAAAAAMCVCVRYRRGPARSACIDPSTHRNSPPTSTFNKTKQQGTASTLTRSEVRGGGKKPYKQKGTGNARRGSNTSPLFPGGGISFGPKPKDWSIKMNKKERRLALATALQSAAADTVVVESVQSDGKTKGLVEALAKAGAPAGAKALLVLAERNDMVLRAGRNVESLAINTADALRVFDVLNADVIVYEKAALAKVKELYSPKAEASA